MHNSEGHYYEIQTEAGNRKKEETEEDGVTTHSLVSHS